MQGVIAGMHGALMAKQCSERDRKQTLAWHILLLASEKLRSASEPCGCDGLDTSVAVSCVNAAGTVLPRCL